VVAEGCSAVVQDAEEVMKPSSGGEASPPWPLMLQRSASCVVAGRDMTAVRPKSVPRRAAPGPLDSRKKRNDEGRVCVSMKDPDSRVGRFGRMTHTGADAVHGLVVSPRTARTTQSVWASR
jgi:hypothetical protein